MTIANDSKIMNENEYKMNISTRSYDCTLYNVHTEENYMFSLNPAPCYMDKYICQFGQIWFTF